MSKKVIDILRKFAEWRSIEWAPDFECPECHKSGVGEFSQEKANLVGWTETDNGIMAILECPHCFKTFRIHAATNDKFDIDEFEVALRCWIIGNSIGNSKELEEQIKL